MADIICKFLTHKQGKPLTFGLVVDQRGSRARPPLGLRALALTANRHPGACAYGKIVLLRDDGLHTLQATASGDTVPAYCGNSTAAALSCLGIEGPLRTRIHGPDSTACTVSARVHAGKVTQRWIVAAEAPRERRWRGRRVLSLTTLNPYAIVAGGLPRGLCPEGARRELLGEGAGKLAVIEPERDNAVVQFYNANGRHGAVPQTGLATLALASRRVAWLRAIFPDSRLTYFDGGGVTTAEFPPVSAVTDGLVAIDLPRTEVSLSPLAMEMVA